MKLRQLPDDEHLLLAARSTGDRAAIGELFDRTAPMLLRFGLRLVNDPNDVEDLVQSTFVSVLQHMERYERGRSVWSWMCGVFMNHVRDFNRKRSRSIDPELVGQPVGRDPVQLAHNKEVSTEIDAAIERLNPKHRDIVRLHIQRGLAPREIVAEIQRPVSTVRTQLARGLDELRGRLPVGLAALFVRLPQWEPRVAALRDRVANSITPIADASASPTRELARRSSSPLSAKALLLVALGAAGVAWATGVFEANRSDTPTTQSVADSVPVPTDGVAEPDLDLPASRVPVDETALGRFTDVRLRLVVRGSEDPIEAAALQLVFNPSGEFDPEDAFLDPRASRRDSRTDAAGIAVFPNVPVGAVATLANDTGFGTSERFTVTRGVVHTLEFERPQRVQGRVVTLSDEPIADAEVWYAANYLTSHGLAAAVTDETGAFSFTVGSPGGDLTLWAVANGYRNSEWINPHTKASTIRLRLADSDRTIRVRVGGESNRPIEGALVRALSLGEDYGTQPIRFGLTDADGVAEFRGATDNRYGVAVRSRGMAPEFRQVPQESDRISLTLGRGTTIFGRILDSRGFPVRTTLRVYPANEATSLLSASLTRHGVSEKSGSFRIDNVGVGEQVVEVAESLESAADHRLQLELHAGETRELTIEMPWQRITHGRLLRPNGEPFGGKLSVSVEQQEVRGYSWMPKSTSVDDDGRFALRGLLDRPYRIYAHSTEVSPGWIALRRIHGNATNLDYRITADEDPSAAIRGRLVWGGSLSAWVIRFRGQGHRFSGSIGVQEDGTFEVGPIGAGEYDLEIYRPGFVGPFHIRDVVVRRGETKALEAFEIVEPGQLGMSSTATLPENLQVVVSNDMIHRTVDARDTAPPRAWYFAPGHWRVRFCGRGFEPVEVPFESSSRRRTRIEIPVTPAPTCELTFLMPPESLVSKFVTAQFFVRDENGTEVVWLTRPSPTTFTYELGLRPGDYSVHAVSTHGTVASASVTVGEAGGACELDLR